VFTLTALEPKEAEMRIIDVDLHTRQQTVAMLDSETGELIEKTLKHDGDEVRKFYSALPDQVLVGIERQVGHPAKIRAAEPRKQKYDGRDAALLLKLQVENRFPAIWMPSTEPRDLRTLLMHRQQWVRMRTRVQNAL
jgi:transposase